MLWATTQHYADFGHQVQTLNQGQPLSDADWQNASDAIKSIILRGIAVA
jgi:TetR/AcrR family transcriptional regulator